MADWTKWPMNQEVYWPKDEKVIGVLGVAPIATADFYTKLVSRTIHKDWQYPRILMDINPKIPSRGRYFDLEETDPSPYVRAGIVKLQECGADFVVIPCNTVHILYEHFADRLSIPVPNIVDVTVATTVKKGFLRPMVLCSRAAREHQIYEKAFEYFHITTTQFPVQKLISEGIEAVKSSRDRDIVEISKSVHEVLDNCHNIDVIIYGCTEVDIMMRTFSQFAKYPFVDSNQALADFCMDFVHNSVVDKRIRLFSQNI